MVSPSSVRTTGPLRSPLSPPGAESEGPEAEGPGAGETTASSEASATRTTSVRARMVYQPRYTSGVYRRIDLRPGGRDRAGAVATARSPRQGHQPHRDVLACGLEREGLEGLGQRIGARAGRVGLGLELGVERGDGLVDRGHRLLRAPHVLGLLEHAPGAAGGGGGPPDGGDRDRLAAEERAQDGGADRDRGLDAL